MRSRLTAVLLPCLVTGCSLIETIDECADLAATVNPTLEGVTLDAGSSETPTAMRRVASVYASLGERLAKKEYRSARLSPLVTQYADLARTVASNAESYAEAIEKKRTRAQRSSVTASKQHAVRQQALNRRIQAVCAGR